MKITIRKITEGEVCAAAEIERACLSTCWSERQIAEALCNENAVYIGAFNDGTLCGIGSAYCVFGDAEIMNVAVLPEHRKSGIGFGIMKALEKSILEMGGEQITLEVAEDNESAVNLYKKCGFALVGIRKGFYKGKNAAVMSKQTSKAF